MNKHLLTQVFFLTCIILVAVPLKAIAQNAEWDEGGWSVEQRQPGRTFYFTHGLAVWGHEFGFIKNEGDCGSDMLWVSYSSSNELVKSFVGQNVAISFSVEEEQFEIKVNMLFADTLALTHVMFFTNFIAGEKFIDLLKHGKEIKVRITAPEALVKSLDIEDDVFNLKGFVDAEIKARESCEDVTKARQRRI